MIKVLRYSLVALLALVCNVSLAQTNLITNGGFEDWTSDSQPAEWKSTTSASASTLSKSTDAHSGSYSVKVGANEKSNKRIAYKEITLKAGTYNVEFYAKGSQVRPGYVPVKDGKVGTYAYGDYATVNTTTWTKVEFSFTLETATTVNLVIMNPKTIAGKNTATDALIDDYSLTTTDGGISTDTPETPSGAETVANIAAFKALATGTTAILTLKDAQVVYKNVYTTKAGATNTELYVRDATGAIQFFNTDLDLAEGQILNGTVEVKYSPYNGMPEAVKTNNTSLEKLTVGNVETIAPKQVTVSDLTDDTYLCELVQVSANITVVEEGEHTNTYLESDGDQVMFYDKFQKGIKPTDGSEHTYVGILVAAKLSGNQVIEFAPTAEVLPTGINGVEAETTNNAPAYNLAGQKVAASYKGIVIKNGKKFVQK